MIRAIVVAALFGASCHHSEISGPGDPSDAQLVTTDIENFWRAYDAGGTTAAFQAEYLDHATSGLEEIHQQTLTDRGFTQADGACLSAILRRRARQHARSRDERGCPPAFAAGSTRLAELYPAAIFRPVTLLVGRFSTGGTTGNSGMLIGSEFYSIDASTPLEELGAFQQGNVHAADSLEFVIAHESIHIQQAAAGSIRGSAGRRHQGGGSPFAEPSFGLLEFQRPLRPATAGARAPAPRSARVAPRSSCYAAAFRHSSSRRRHSASRSASPANSRPYTKFPRRYRIGRSTLPFVFAR